VAKVSPLILGLGLAGERAQVPGAEAIGMASAARQAAWWTHGDGSSRRSHNRVWQKKTLSPAAARTMLGVRGNLDRLSRNVNLAGRNINLTLYWIVAIAQRRSRGVAQALGRYRLTTPYPGCRTHPRLTKR
jgi:hypothetical protein